MSTSPEVIKMIAACPARNDNSIGKVAKSSLLNKLIFSTPGGWGDSWTGKTIPYLRIFYPKAQASPHLNFVASITGIPDILWTAFSISLLCKEIWDQAPETRRLMNQSLLNSQFLSWNVSLQSKLVAWYSYILKTTFSELASSLTQVSNIPAALKEYKEVLLSPQYREANKQLEQAGSEIDLTWVFFHHWVKLSILGASDAEIGTIFQTLTSQGLSLSPVINATGWRKYYAWFESAQPGTFASSDIDAFARKGVQDWYVNMGPFQPKQTEGYSQDFLRTFGKGYYVSPTASCFTGDTIVLMADGSSKSISLVTVGENVSTPTGPRKVAMQPRPIRGDRSLYSIDDLKFRFTGSHAFVHPKGNSQLEEPEYQCVDPWRLRYTVPTMGRLGVGQLEKNALLSVLENGEIGTSKINALVEHKNNNENDASETLFDLVLVPNKTGRSHYYVGDGACWFLVASEIPVVTEAPWTAITMLSLLSESANHILPQFANVSEVDLPERIDKLLTRYPDIFSNAIQKIDCTNVKNSDQRISSHELLAEHLPSFNVPDENGNYTYNSILGRYYECLALRFGDAIDSFAELGWRTFSTDIDADWMAITLLDLQLNHTHCKDPNGVMKVVVQADDENFEGINISEERSHTFFAHHFDKVIYLPMRNMEKFKVKFTDNSDVVLTTEGTIVIDQPYKRTELVVRDESGEACGLFCLDVRLLSSSENKEEKARRKDWNDSKKEAFAEFLGKNMADLLTSRK